MNLTLFSRDFSQPLGAGGLRFQVERMSWRAQGGPDAARVRVRGPRAALHNLTQRLRCPAVIDGAGGAPLWWGYLHAAEIGLGQAVLRLSLDGLANRVAVRWRDETPLGGGSQDWDQQTAWEDAPDSQRLYGIKERVFHLGEARQAEAEAARSSHLRRHQRPAAAAVQAGLPGDPYALLHLRGWWSTLDWRMFTETRGYLNAPGEGASQAVGQPTPPGISLAQSFSVGADWELAQVWLRAGKTGQPADTLQLSLHADAGGAPGSALGSAQLDASALTGALGWQKFTFQPGVALSAGALYWLKAQRSGALSATSYYRVAVDESLPFGAGVLRIFNGGWVARSPEADLVFQAFGQLETSVQMQNIVSTAGQFLCGCSVRCASGTRARMARSGKRSALEELRELLAWGTAAGEDLEARVTPERQLVIEARPAPESAAWLVNQAGEVRHRSGRAPLPGETVAGGWARLEGLLLEGDAAPQSVFLEQVVWEDGRLRAQWE